MNNKNEKRCKNCIYWELNQKHCTWNYDIKKPMEICINNKFMHKNDSGWVGENEKLEKFIDEKEPKTIIKTHYRVILASGSFNIFPTYAAAKDRLKELEEKGTTAKIMNYINCNGIESLLNVAELPDGEIFFYNKQITFEYEQLKFLKITK